MFLIIKFYNGNLIIYSAKELDYNIKLENLK